MLCSFHYNSNTFSAIYAIVHFLYHQIIKFWLLPINVYHMLTLYFFFYYIFLLKYGWIFKNNLNLIVLCSIQSFKSKWIHVSLVIDTNLSNYKQIVKIIKQFTYLVTLKCTLHTYIIKVNNVCRLSKFTKQT